MVFITGKAIPERTKYQPSCLGLLIVNSVLTMKLMNVSCLERII